MAGEYVLSVILKATNLSNGAVGGFMKNIDAAHAAVLGFAIGGAAAIVGLGVASVQMAGAYDQNMRKVQALTGSNTAQMTQYDSSLKKLAVNAGVAPKELADGLYNVMSAGYKGKDAINVLTLATEDAKIGMTSAAITSDALTNVMASFSVKASDATRVNGEMLQTVTLGKATFEQYASSIVKSASSASQFHVSMETMNAAWSTMTANGIKAAQASTDFQSSLKVMYANIGTVTKSLHSNGIAFNETKFNAMSYGDKVKYLNAALQTANDKHVKVTGATLQASQAISTIAQHIDTYNSNLSSLSDKTAMAKKTQEAWAVTQGGFNQSMSRLQASLQVLMITIGQALIPVLTKIVGAITPIVTQFTAWLSQGQNMQMFLTILGGVLAGFATIILAIVVPAMWAWAVATIAATWPILLAGAIVAAVVIGILLAYQHWGAIMDWISGKAEQMRIKNEQAHVKMRIAADNNTAEQAKKAIANIDKERVGILEKLRQTHDPAERMELEHQLHMLNIQEQHQAKRQALAERDRAEQIAKQKKLHDDLIESQKNWFQRFLDMIGSWIGDQMNKLGTMVHGWMGLLGQLKTNVTKIAWDTVYNFMLSVVQWKDQSIAKVQALINGLRTLFAALPQLAMQWGINLLTGFISGISSKIGDLKNMASGAIQAVKNVLGFASPAKEGPGSNADQWAPNLMKMYVKGIQGGMAGIKVAVKNAAALMKAGFTGDANQLNQKINAAQYQVYLDKVQAADNKYRQSEAKHHETWLADQHKRYEKYLAARQKALDKYESEKHHKKAFSYHDFKVGKFHALKETLPKFTGLSLGAFANQTNILDPTMGNGAPMALPASATGSNQVVHVDNSVNLVVHGSVVNHAQLLKDLQTQQDKNHRMQGTHVTVTSGGRAK